MDLKTAIGSLAGALVESKEGVQLYHLRKQVAADAVRRNHLEIYEQTMKTLNACNPEDNRISSLIQKLQDHMLVLEQIPEINAYFNAEREFGVLFGNVMQNLHELIYKSIKR